MAINLTDEVMKIRERLAHIEASIAAMAKQMENAPTSRSAIVIPVSVVLAVAEILRTIAEHYYT